MKKILQSLWVFILSMSVYAQTPIHQFNFDGNVTNTANTVTLTTNTISYGNDRNGLANKALYMGATTASQASANLTNIPLGNSQRTISIWYRADSSSSISNPLFSYGTDTNNNAMMLTVNFDASNRMLLAEFGGISSTNVILNGTFNANIWHHYVITYNGSAVKLYLDGNLMLFSANAGINTIGTQFNIGNRISTNDLSAGWYDDLQIYNTALTDAQVNQLYTNNTLATATVPTISSVSSTNITTNSATVNCDFYTNGAITTTTIYYGTSSTALNLLAGSSGNTNHSVGVSSRSFSLTGLQPSTTYYYKLNASNSAGNVDSTVYSFMTSAASSGSSITDGLIAYYGFEGNFNSHNNLHNLTASPNAPITNTASGKVGAGANFVTSNNEGLVNSSSLNSALTGNEFTICYWVQQQTLNSPGADYPSHFEMFGSGFVRHDGGGSSLNVGYGTSATTFNTGSTTFVNNYNVWTHIAVVHKANLQEFEIYINGVLTTTYLSNSNPIPNLYKFSTNFHIGTGSTALKAFKGNIDEFYIYNRALTTSEIITVRDNTSAPLSTSSYSNKLKFNLYPNPAKDVVSVSLENELKSVEVYSLQGQKVLSAFQKEFNISQLNSGIYLVKIEDVNGNVSSQKLIKK